jgi:type I restriction enzyme S subunit
MKELTQSGYSVYGANGLIGYFNSYTHDKTTIAVTCRGATCGTVNVVPAFSYITGNAMALDDLDECRVDIGYLAAALRARGFNDVISGSAQPQITRQPLLNIQIPLPPLYAQHRIAAILDQADALRRKRHRALERLESFTKAIFFELFGDPHSNDHKWPPILLKDFFYFRTGKLDSNAAVPSGKFPFFTCAREDFRIDTYAFDCEALLLAGNNANADYSVKHYKGKFNAYQRTYVITLRNPEHSYEFARFALEYRLAELKRISKGTNTKYLTLELLNNISVPLPPPPLQQKFDVYASRIDKLTSQYRAHLAKLDELFASLEHRAFRGELISASLADGHLQLEAAG